MEIGFSVFDNKRDVLSHAIISPPVEILLNVVGHNHIFDIRMAPKKRNDNKVPIINTPYHDLAFEKRSLIVASGSSLKKIPADIFHCNKST